MTDGRMINVCSHRPCAHIHTGTRTLFYIYTNTNHTQTYGRLLSCTRHTHKRPFLVRRSSRNGIMNYYERCVCLRWYVCFHSLQPSVFCCLRFSCLLFAVDRITCQLHGLAFSIACVLGTKRSHYLCCRPNRARFQFDSYSSSA